MSYWLEDATEAYLGDFASNVGLAALRSSEHPALQEFIALGEADEELVGQIVAETKDDESLAYIAEMLDGARPPVFLTDGSGAVSPEEVASDGE